MIIPKIVIQILFFLLGQPEALPEPISSIFDPGKIHRVDLNFYDSHWKEQLMAFKDARSNERLLATIEIDGHRFDSVGIRHKGHSSYYNFANDNISKLPFNLKSDFRISDQDFESGIRTIKLSNIFRDRTYCREYVAYQVASRYVPMPKIAFAEVYDQGKYLGLYQMIESIDEAYLDRTFGEKDGAFFKCDPKWNKEQPDYCPKSDNASLQYLGDNKDCYKKYYEKKSKEGWEELINLCRNLDEGEDGLDDILDIHQTLWMLAINNILVNLDSYIGGLGHNYYLYQTRSGKFVPLSWDLNLSFGAFKSTGDGKRKTHQDLAEISPYLHFRKDYIQRPLINKILSTPQYRKVYIHMVKTIYQDFFESGELERIVEKTNELVRPSVLAENGAIYPLKDFESNFYYTIHSEKDSLVGLMELIQTRTEYLAQHPSLSREGPQIVSVYEVEGDNGTVTIAAYTKKTENVTAYLKKKNDFTFYKYNMTKSGASSYTLTIPKNEYQAYYLVIEADRSAILYPEGSPGNLIPLP